MELNLYVFYVGGMLPGRKIENHDIVFAIGQTVEDCYDQIKDQCSDFSGLHIDSYTLYDGIFGLRVDIVDSKLAINNANDESLYLLSNQKFRHTKYMNRYANLRNQNIDL